MNYTEKTLAQVLEKNPNNITISELDTDKVYVFRIKNAQDCKTSRLHEYAYNIKNKLEELGLKFVIIVDDNIEITELERSENND